MEQRYVCLDTETTGLSHKDGDRVIEVGAVRVVGNVITEDTFHEYINPGRRKVHEDALKVHGITDEFLRDKPSMDRVYRKFVDWVGDDDVVIHNAPFDMGFLNAEADIVKMPRIGNKVVDSLTVARKQYPGSKVNLDALCTRFSVDRSGRTYHGALIDSFLLAQVYIHMMGLNRLDLGDRPTLGSGTGAQDFKTSRVVNLDGRPYRAPRLLVSPSETEKSRHDVFVDKKIKNPVWANFSSQNG